MRLFSITTELLLATHLIFSAPLALAITELPEPVMAQLAALDKKRQKAITEACKPLTELDEKYLAALTRVRKSAQAVGDLRKVLSADQEIKQLKAGNKDDNAPGDAEVALLKKTYAENISTRQTGVFRKITEVERQYAAGLAGIVSELTKAGMIKEAKHVRELEHAVRGEIKQIEDGTKTPTMGVLQPKKSSP